MATFTAPTLYTVIDRALYEAQHNSNFSKIQTALITLQNILPGIVGANAQPSSLTWIRHATLPDGVIGRDAFVPSFTDGASATVQITHPSYEGRSSAMMQDALHSSTTSYTKDLTTLTSLSDETIEVTIGLRSLGAPALEYVVAVDSTDADIDLALYTFDLTVVGGATWFSKNLRRACDVIMDREAFTDLEVEESALTFTAEGALPSSTGVLNYGFIAPFNLTIQEAQFYLATAPSGGQTIEAQLVDEDNLTDGNVLNATASWAATTGLEQVSGQTPAAIIQKGRRVLLELVQADAGATGGDLMATVLIRRHRYEIL